MNISKNDNRSELDRKVKRILLYKKKIHRNSTCSNIMEMLYPDTRFTVQQIASKTNKPYLYTKKIVLQMQSDGYLLHDGKKYNKEYFLSSTGRWFAVCIKLDYIPFQSLCILSQTYCKVKRDPNSKASCYMISKFRDTFDKSYDDEDGACASAVYTSRNISQSIRMLTDRSLLYWANEDFVKISPGIFDHLQKYNMDFISLVSWQNEIFEKCRKEQFKVIMTNPGKKNLFSFIGQINK
ncbi:MAG: hypothetical protein OEL81_03365 [Nitrosopumilus sp.]|nr:hypothetical protein [Nitrosopumilus sp.]